MLDLDLNNVFEEGLRNLYEASRRDDEHLPHVSHLGKCLLQTRLSRGKAPKIEMTHRGYQFLMKGLHDEEYIVDVLKRGLPKLAPGWTVINVDTINADLTGHIDFEIANVQQYHVLIEIKTTQWKERWESLGEISAKTGKPIKTKVLPGPYPDPSITHRFQAIGYCQRRPLNPDGRHMPYAIFQWDRALHGFHQYPRPGEWYDSDEPTWLARHDEWTKKVIDLTDPSTDPVAMGIATVDADGMLVGKPPEDWMCGYCDFAQCRNNVNKNNAEHAIEEVAF